jgi:hypothetical protein
MSSAAAAAAAKTEHVLDLKNYTLDELLDLFQLDYNMTPQDLNQAKKKVLMLHPDKSKLPAEYFLFYKRAFDKIVELYSDLTKHNRPIRKEATIYNSDVSVREPIAPELKKKIVSPDFNRKFNELFERAHGRPGAPADNGRNEWFSKEAADYDVPQTVSRENMAQAMELLREKSSSVVANYRGFQEINSACGVGNNLYESDEPTDDYVATPVFKQRNLVFDDIRKVHRDETIIPVKYAGAPNRLMSVDEYVATRDAGGANVPIPQKEAERILAEKEKSERAAILEKQYRDKIRSDENSRKSQSAMSYFLRLENK